jgi:hypothetical protein
MTQRRGETIEERIAGVHREVAYAQLHKEIGAIPTAVLTQPLPEGVSLVDAILEVVESKEQ